jgi:hypothetical protein
MHLKAIIKEYCAVLNEFLLQVLSNADSKYREYSSVLIFNGLNLISYMFEYSLIRNKQLQPAIYLSRKASIYYLEYIHQTIQTATETDLHITHNDAIEFVYKKTLFQQDGQSDNTTISNIMTMNDDAMPITNIELEELCKQLFTLSYSLLCPSNSTFSLENRVQLYSEFLERFSMTLINPYHVGHFYFSTLFIDSIEMPFMRYVEVLSEIANLLEKKKLQSKEPITNSQLFLKIYTNKEGYSNKLLTMPAKQFVAWLIE